MKPLIMLAIVTSLSAYADYFCALGSKSPTNLNAQPYATMQVDFMSTESVQLTIVPNYESIKYEVVVANLASTITKNDQTVSTFLTADKGQVVLTVSSEEVTVDYGTKYTCDKLPLKD